MSEIEYNDLVFDISTKINVNQLEKMVFMCRGQISKSRKKKFKNVLELLVELEEQGNLGIDRLETLKQILERLKNQRMLKKVKEFENKRKAQSVGIIASFKQAAVNLKGAIKMICNSRNIGRALLVVSAGMALYECSTLDEYFETFTKMVLPASTKLIEIREGSLCFTVQAETPAALKELWDIYKDGTLQRRLQKFLVNDDIKQLTDAEDIEVAVFIDEQEYMTSFNFLQNQVPDLKEERFRRKSDSFFHINSNQREIAVMRLTQVENQLSFERQVHGEEIKKLKEKIILTRESRAPNIKQEELPGRRTRRHSESFLYYKRNEVEVASMRQLEQAEEWRKEKQIFELKIAELEETLKAERMSNMDRKHSEATTLGRPWKRRRRNSDSNLYYMARKEGVEQTEKQPERALEGGAQMDLERRMFVHNYLQNRRLKFSVRFKIYPQINFRYLLYFSSSSVVTLNRTPQPCYQYLTR